MPRTDLLIADDVGLGKTIVTGLVIGELRQGRRFTITPDIQVEGLDRLLELNQERYAEEFRRSMHTKKEVKRTKKSEPAEGLPLDVPTTW